MKPNDIKKRFKQILKETFGTALDDIESVSNPKALKSKLDALRNELDRQIRVAEILFSLREDRSPWGFKDRPGRFAAELAAARLGRYEEKHGRKMSDEDFAKVVSVARQMGEIAEGRACLSFRPVRGDLADAMAEIRWFASPEPLKAYVRDWIQRNNLELRELSSVHLGFDGRIGEHSFRLDMEGVGPVGYTNFPISSFKMHNEAKEDL